jgi:hypothetical protein
VWFTKCEALGVTQVRIEWQGALACIDNCPLLQWAWTHS